MEHSRTPWRRAWLAALLALAAACGSPVAPPPGTQATVPPGFPEGYYRQARAENAGVFQVDAARSLVAIEVRRGGSLARLGHDHLVASHGVQGYVAVGRGRADLFVPLDGLTVDEPALRAKAGLTTAVSPEAAEGTRRNMLEKVLDSARYPFALIRVTGAGTDGSPVAVDLTLHGATRHYEVPVVVERSGRDLVISGRMKVRQTEFGIAPFAVLGGALRVEDEVSMDFRVVTAGS
ncbi:MAG TPA: YceI family protein [Rhodocyclaceae bacterium]|nr:YceI family protein [Rhodocyclaceae bacterium]